MIAKRVDITKNDNYGRLAEYISAGEEKEKCLAAWCAGCQDNDDYSFTIQEVELIQTMNVRTDKPKTYHLVLSFRPEDEEKLSPAVFRDMERRFAEALGFSNHQRHCGIHQNTGNIHMHVAYNMIHPENHKRHEPFRDFYSLSHVCRTLENEYGLSVDRGITPGEKTERIRTKAATVEAQTGQESFESYAVRHKVEIMKTLQRITNWQGLHESFAQFSMDLKPHGSGLAVKDRYGKHAVKASAMDRALSLKKLEVRLGPYQPPKDLQHIREQSRYQAVPLHRGPERGELFIQYRAGIEERKTRLEAAKLQEDAVIAAIKQKWKEERKRIEGMGIAKKNRHNLLALARKHEAEALAKARLQTQSEREAVRRAVPYTSWKTFLLREADTGNEIALAVLRSKAEKIEPEIAESKSGKDWSRHGREYSNQTSIRAEFTEKQRALQEREDLTAKGKKRLQAVLSMEQVAAEARAKGLPIPAIIHRIDGTGTIIFSLAGGGTIRDSGKEILFSPHHQLTKELALLYGNQKWGQHIETEKGRMVRALDRERTKNLSR